MVRQMLIKRSQLQPVINAAAAGGKRIATCGDVFVSIWGVITTKGDKYKDEADV